MAASIGVIAEDRSDVDVLYALTCKLGDESSFKFQKFAGGGSGKLRSKCRLWARLLLLKGCEYLVVVHDLDDRNELELRRELEALVDQVGFEDFLVLIPIREIEAWLLCDRAALKQVFGTVAQPKVPAHPETLEDPKKTLRDAIKKSGGHLYIHTVHNKKIAEALQIDSIAKKCGSFRPYVEFVNAVLQ